MTSKSDRLKRFLHRSRRQGRYGGCSSIALIQLESEKLHIQNFYPDDFEEFAGVMTAPQHLTSVRTARSKKVATVDDWRVNDATMMPMPVDASVQVTDWAHPTSRTRSIQTDAVVKVNIDTQHTAKSFSSSDRSELSTRSVGVQCSFDQSSDNPPRSPISSPETPQSQITASSLDEVLLTIENDETSTLDGSARHTNDIADPRYFSELFTRQTEEDIYNMKMLVQKLASQSSSRSKAVESFPLSTKSDRNVVDSDFNPNARKSAVTPHASRMAEVRMTARSSRPQSVSRPTRKNIMY